MRAQNLDQLFQMIFKYSAILVLAITIIGGGLGYLFDGVDGMVSALIGATMAIVFSLLTAVSVFIGGRLSLAAFYGAVLGGWLVKIVLFAIALAGLQTLEFINGVVLFLSIVATILGTLVIDSLAALRARIPVVE